MPEAAGSTVSLTLLIQAVDKASKTVASIQKQLNEASKAAKGFSQESGESAKKGKQGFDDLGNSVVKVGDKIKKVEQATEAFGAVAFKLTGLAASILVPFGLAVKSSADFEQSMSKVLAVTTNAQENFEELKNVAGELGRTTKFTAREAAEGMTYLGQAGFDAQEVIAGIGPSLTLAVAAAVELGQAADIASNVLSGMRLPISELNNVVDVMAKTAAETNTELIDMAEALSYAGPVAAASGVAFEELSTFVGLLGNAGIKGTRAGTALRGALFALTAPSEKAKNTLKDLGVEIAYNVDGSIDLVKIFHDLADAGLTAADANQIFGRYATAAVLAINGQIDALDGMLESNYAAAGAAQEMADIMKTNLKGAITGLFSALDGLKRAFGDQLLKPLTLLVKGLTSLITTVTEITQKFPVMTTLIGALAGAVIALSSAFSILAFSVAALNGVLGLLQAQAVKTVAAFTVSKMTAFGQALLALGSTSVSLTGALGAVKVAVLGLFGAVQKLWALLVAHPIGAIVAAVGILIYAFFEWNERLDRLTSESRKLAAELAAMNENIGRQVDSISKLEVGSRKYQATLTKLRKELLQVAENQDELADEATNAANSINSLTGEFIDGGEALRDFQQAAKELEFDTIQEQVGFLEEKMKRATGEAGPLNFALVAVQQAYGSLYQLVTGGDITKPLFDARRESEKFRKSIESTAGAFITRLEAYKDIDMSASVKEMEFFFKEVRGMSEETSNIFVGKFGMMQEAARKTSRSAKDIAEITTDKLRKDVEDTIDTIADLGAAYEEASERSRRAIDALASGGSTEDATAAYNQRIEANRNLLEAEELLSKNIKNLRASALEDVKNTYDDEIRELEKRNKLGYLKEYEYQQEKAAIEERFSIGKRDVLQKSIQYSIESNSRDLELTAELVKEKKGLDREVIRSSEEVKNQRIIHANQIKDAVVKIEEETANILASLGSPTDQIASQREADIATLYKTAKDIGLRDTEVLAKAELAIKKKYARQEAEYQQDLLELRQDRDIAAAQRRADGVVKALEDAFNKRLISPEDYVNNATQAQTQALDAEIATIMQRIEFAQNTLNDQPLVIKLQTQLDDLTSEKEQLKAEQAEKLRQAQLAQANQELSMQQRLAQGDLELMNNRTATYEEMSAQKLQLMELAFAQEVIQMEQAGATAVEIERRKQQQITQVAQEGERLRIEGMKKTFDLYGEVAGEASQAFGDLYEASGKEVKEFFYLQKAAKIAETIMSTQSAAMTAYEAGPYVGPVLAALVYAQGAASIAKITAQKLAEGGLVGGYSPTATSDNIPAWLTAKEYVHPVDTVKHYGVGAMDAIRKKLVPPELLRGYALPTQSYGRPSRRGYASGGVVSGQNDMKRETQGMGEQKQEQSPINIVNVVDPSVMDQYLASNSGKNMIFNVLKSNAYEFNNIMASEM